MNTNQAFKEWFGLSKVADAEGKPLLMFHGTNKGFDRFEIRAGEKDSGWYGSGVYLTSDPSTASAYSVYESLKSSIAGTGGANVMPVHVSLQNPYLWPAGRKAAITPEETDQLTKELVALGYDGVIVSNENADPLYASHYEVVAFHPAQVKSATGNRGTYDPLNTDIRFSLVDQDETTDKAALPMKPTPAFQQWFGDSLVVDADGNPLVVYHGTYGDFDNFKRRTGDIGLHFGDAATASDRVAFAVPHRGNKDGKNLSASVMPVYLSIKNPLRLRDHGYWNAMNMKGTLLEMFPQDALSIGREYAAGEGLKSTKDIREFLQSKNYDGVIYKNTGEVTGSEPFRERIAEAREEMDKVFPKGKRSFDLEDQQLPEYKAWIEAKKVYTQHCETAGTDSYIAFSPEQVKSALGNNGEFNVANTDIRFSLADQDEEISSEAPCP